MNLTFGCTQSVLQCSTYKLLRTGLSSAKTEQIAIQAIFRAQMIIKLLNANLTKYVILQLYDIFDLNKLGCASPFFEVHSIQGCIRVFAMMVKTIKMIQIADTVPERKDFSVFAIAFCLPVPDGHEDEDWT